MTTATAPRHPFEQLLAQLTGAMNVQHDFGAQADAGHTTADRIVWIPDGLGTAAATYDLPNAEVTARQVAPFAVSIFGASPASVYERHAELVAWLDLIVGPPKGSAPSEDGTMPHRPGYAVGDAKVAPRGGDAQAAGWGTVVPVTLYQPIVRRYFPTAPVLGVSVAVSTTALDGSAEQAAIP